MRNLKRALSLALASVMLLGMMVVGTSAKGLEDFGDAAEITNADAVAVTSEIGIFKGYDDGEFKPENVVTRAEMAVIIAKMLYGSDVKVEQFAELNTFTDTPAWAEGYINLCASLGIITGRGNGIFDPNGVITTAEAATMLTKALGWFQNDAEFGNDWMLAATARATQIGLYGDLKLSAKAGLTREDVAVMVFNALTAAIPVQYNSLLNVYYNENMGITAKLGFDYTETLGYKNFDLVYRDGDVTTYGRPATTWGFGSYDDHAALTEDGGLFAGNVNMLSSDEIVTIAATPDFKYVDKVSQKNLYKAVGKTVVETYDWESYTNGAYAYGQDPLSKTSSTKYGYTNPGVVTEIYVNDDTMTVTIVYIDQFLTEVTKVKTDDDGEYITVKKTLDDKTFYVEGYEEDDMVVITVDVDADGDTYIASVYAPETVDGEVSAVDQDKLGRTYVELDDTKYTYNSANIGDIDEALGGIDTALNVDYRLFLDANGYVVGYDQLEDEAKTYLYVKDADTYLGDIQAKVVFADGTTATINVADELGDAAKTALTDESQIKTFVCSYTKDSKDVYTLTPYEDMANTNGGTFFGIDEKGDVDPEDKNQTIENKSAWMDGVLCDEKTIYVDVQEKNVYVGYENVPTVEDADVIYVLGNNGAADLVFIIDYVKIDTKADIWFYVAKVSDYKSKKDADGVVYTVRNVYVNGEKTEMLFKANDNGQDGITAKGLYRATKTNEKDYVTTYVQDALDNKELSAVGSGTFVNGYMYNAAGETFATAGVNYWYWNDETIFVYVKPDTDDTVSVGSAKDMVKKADATDIGDVWTQVTIVENDKNLAEVVYLYEQENKGTQGDNTAITVTLANGTVAVANAADAKLVDVLNAIEAQIIEEGYTVTDKKLNDGVYTFSAKTVTAGFETNYTFTYVANAAKIATNVDYATDFTDYLSIGVNDVAANSAIRVELYAGDELLGAGEQLFADAYKQVSLAFYADGRISSSWNSAGATWNTEKQPTKVVLYVNGVEIDSFDDFTRPEV